MHHAASSPKARIGEHATNTPHNICLRRKRLQDAGHISALQFSQRYVSSQFRQSPAIKQESFYCDIFRTNSPISADNADFQKIFPNQDCRSSMTSKGLRIFTDSLPIASCIKHRGGRLVYACCTSCNSLKKLH